MARQYINRHDPDGIFTGLSVYVNDPDGSGLDPSTMSLLVKGPSGLSYQFLPEDLQAAPVFSRGPEVLLQIRNACQRDLCL